MKRLFILTGALAITLATAQAATFSVTSTSDSGPRTLRQAILLANAAGGSNTINLTVNGTIVLNSPLPVIAANTAILGPGTGPGTNLLTISGNDAVQVFTVSTNVAATISGLTIANGKATAYSNGAGIANAGKLTILNSVFLNNTNLYGWGGGIFNSGSLTIANSVFSRNSAIGENGSTGGREAPGGGGGAGLGGGLFSMSGTVNITDCTFTENSATGGNGGFSTGTPLTQLATGCGGGVNRGCGGDNGGFGGGGGGVARTFTVPDPVQNARRGGFGGGGGGGSNYGGKGGFGGGDGSTFGTGGGGAGIGGAIFVDGGDVTIVNCSFVGNRTSGGEGGSPNGGKGKAVVGGIFTRTGKVSLRNSGVGITTDAAPLETWSYNGVEYLAPVGTPKVGQFVVGEIVNRGPVIVSLETGFGGGTIVYSRNGSDPRSDSTVFRGPFRLWRTAILRAVAFNSNFTASVEMDPVQITVLPTVSAVSKGGGTVTIEPKDGPYYPDSIAQITAQPASGFTFLQWLGDANGTNPVATLTMDQNKFVEAVFGTSLGDIGVVVGRGSVRLTPSLPLYPFGTTVKLAAIPELGSGFAQWGGSGAETNNPLSFVVSKANQSVVAIFSALRAGQSALAVSENGEGQVAINPKANAYSTGQIVTLIAMPDPGQDFIGWSGDASGTQNPLVVTMNSSRVITANFTKRPTLSVQPPLAGMTPAGFRLLLTGEFGGAYRILASTNFADWLRLGVVTIQFGTVQFIDEATTNSPLRFYRAESQ